MVSLSNHNNVIFLTVFGLSLLLLLCLGGDFYPTRKWWERVAIAASILIAVVLVLVILVIISTFVFLFFSPF